MKKISKLKRGNPIKKLNHRYSALSKNYKIIVFVLVFGVIGLVFLFATRASSPTANFEAESATLTNCAKQVTDTTAAGGKAIQFTNCTVSTAGTTFPVHPGVVYTQAQIDAWSTSDPDYTALASKTLANSYSDYTSYKYKPMDYGTQINSAGNPNCGLYSNPPSTACELNDGFKDQSGYAKVQAVLWAADGIQGRKDKVIAYLNGYKKVTSFEQDSAEQRRLVAGWAVTNLVQAAEIVGYHDAEFDNFLRYAYGMMDWTANPNWHASFADSKLAIAAYLGDATLWADAKAYFYERIKQSFWHGSHDVANKPFPMHTEDNGSATRLHAPPGTPKIGATQQHWGRDHDPSGVGQVKADGTFDTARFGQPVNGMNAERVRDLGHVNMGLSGWMHGARTIIAQGETLEQHAYDRLLTGYSYHSGRVLYFAQTNTFAAPVPFKGDGGGSRFMGYYGARKLFGAATPQSVKDMIARTEVNTTYAHTVSNHNVAEKFADE